MFGEHEPFGKMREKKFKGQQSSGQLLSRLVIEERFHDSKYKQGSSTPYHYRYSPTYRIFSAMKNGFIGNICGKRVLEYGCGDGWVTKELALMGAELDSFDISGEAVKKTYAMLETMKIAARCSVRRMAAEEVDYPDDAFDVVVGFAILHHLDLDKAMPELYRVMKPGGVAVFAEPLGSNPFLKFYRRLTPQYRTADERPLILREFMRHTRKFKRFSHEEHYLLSLLALGCTSVRGLRKLSEIFIEPFMRTDDKLLRAFRGLRRFAWYSIMTFTK